MKFKSLSILTLTVFLLIVTRYQASEQKEENTEENQNSTNNKDEKTDKKGDKKDKPKEEKKEDPTKPINIVGYKPVKCNKDVVGILGISDLQPVTKSLKHGFPLCPRVKNACCSATDMDKFMQHWEKVTQPRLKKAFPAQKSIYVKLMDKMLKVHEKAKIVYSHTIDAPESECKILSRTILTLRMENVVRLIKGSLDKCHDSLKKAYKGIYCSICNADYHQLINPSAKEFILSYQDCRELTVGCHKYLLYMHAHLPEILNLLLDFTAQCSNDGEFKKFKVDDAKLINRAEDVSKKLEEARDNRNGNNWANFFKPICGEFKMGEMTEYFMPNIKKYDEYTKYIEKALSGKLQEEAAKKKAAKSKKTGEKGSGKDKTKDEETNTDKKNSEENNDQSSTSEPSDRLLANKKDNEEGDKKDKNEAEKKDELNINIFAPFKIFNSDPSNSLPIDEFKTLVEASGIDIFLVTSRSLLTADELEAAKKLSNVTIKSKEDKKKDGKKKDKKDKQEKNQAETNKNRRLRRIRRNKKTRKTRRIKL